MRQAVLSDIELIRELGLETVAWTRDAGLNLWSESMFEVTEVTASIESGHFWVAFQDDTLAGMLKFELEDEFFWPEVPRGESAFVHRLAVGREFAGRGVSQFMLRWAVERARGLGLKYLRLDCLHDRQPLRDLYESFGFRYHSPKQAGPYFVARYEYPL